MRLRDELAPNLWSEQATGLLHWWPFVDGAGGARVLDLGPRGQHGTLVGPTWAADPDGEPDADTVLSFDGSNDYVNCGTLIQPTGSQWSYSAWVYPTDVTGFDAGQDQIAGAGYNGVGTGLALGWSFGTFPGYLGFISYESGPGVHGARSSKLWGSGDLHKWWHVGGSWDGSAYRLYINGVEDTVAVSSQTNPYQSSVRFCLGCQDQNGTLAQFLTGRLFDVRVYRRALPRPVWWQMFDPATRWDLWLADDALLRAAAQVGVIPWHLFHSHALGI